MLKFSNSRPPKCVNQVVAEIHVSTLNHSFEQLGLGQQGVEIIESIQRDQS
jgi:hypothetical protein